MKPTEPDIADLVEKWRERARKAGRYGVAQSMESDREYYGMVNAALAVAECADELDTALRACAEAPETAAEKES